MIDSFYSVFLAYYADMLKTC